MLDILGRDIEKEMKTLCAIKASSILRESSAEAVSSFTWDKLRSVALVGQREASL